MEDILIPIVAITGVFGSASFIAWVILEAIRTRQQATLAREFSNKLLDRVSSAQEFAAMMNSEAGERFLAHMSGARADSPAHTRILKSTQMGFVLLALGVGLFLFGFMTPALLLEANQTINVFATIATSLGAGLLLAAAAAYVISKSLGLLNGQPRSDRDDRLHTA